MGTSNGRCPICGGAITKKTWVGHVNTGAQAHGHLYKAFCDSCQIMLERKIVGTLDTGWFSSSVNARDVINELSDEEVAQVELILDNYPNLLYQWQEFIGQKQERDTVCRFKEKGSQYTGLTIKRENHLIGRFSVFRNL